MDDQKQHIIDSLKQANNILVTVRNDPSIDQLSACIALTLLLNELGKHGTAVFSGRVPSALEFLEPEKTIERTTDSLRDFIISLDKAKADKLRYKIEDTVVKIYITPYKTSISDKDLEFGQGDFNVDVVVALGVHSQNDVDEAITAHGRILHDATVISINTDNGASEDLGSISWVDANVSSLSEMVAGIANSLGKEDVLDNQIATALLTGIVAETERFGNAKTTPSTMEVAAKLLTAGANQELVAAKLSAPAPVAPAAPERPIEPVSSRSDDDSYGGSGGGNVPLPAEPVERNDVGALKIEHPAGQAPDQFEMPSSPEASAPFEAAQLTEPSAEQPVDTPVEQLSQPVDNMPPQGDSEELAALDYLKGRKVESKHTRGKIEPLRDQNNYLEGMPRINPERRQSDKPDASPQGLDGNKYNLSPPSMGGTLTASMDSGHESPSVASIVNNNESLTPMLDHDRPGVAPAEPLVVEAAPADAGLITPLFDQPVSAPQAVTPAPAEPAAPALNTPGGQTLADIEKRVNSPHIIASPTNGGESNPEGAMDMPKPAAPATVDLPMPLITPLDREDAAPTSTPPPVPPPLPPLPSANTQ